MIIHILSAATRITITNLELKNCTLSGIIRSVLLGVVNILQFCHIIYNINVLRSTN